jgi:urease accessory protein
MASIIVVAREVLRFGAWDEARETGRLTLRADERLRRRGRFALDEGDRDILLDLPRALRLRDGDGLELIEGGVVRIVAALEQMLEIRAGATRLERIAYHFGNRHLPLQIADDFLVVPADRLTAEFARAIGADVREVKRVFEPEPGAHGEHPHAHPT